MARREDAPAAKTAGGHVSNSSLYVNPFTGAGTYTAERVDQGQDFSLSPGAQIRAVGKARVISIDPNFYDNEPAIYYQLLEGPDAGRVVYTAEQIQPAVKVGQVVNAGQPIGTYAPTGTGIEIGWGANTGVPLAQTTTGYKEGEETAAGKSFSGFLKGLGVNTGTGTHSAGSCPEIVPGEYSVPLLGEALEGACKFGQSTGKAAEHAAEEIGEQAVKGAIGLVKPIATKISLYAVLLFGAMGMIVFGLQELLKPVGGPDIKQSIGRLGAGAAVAAA
jgi:hypothetical protein